MALVFPQIQPPAKRSNSYEEMTASEVQDTIANARTKHYLALGAR